MLILTSQPDTAQIVEKSYSYPVLNWISAQSYFLILMSSNVKINGSRYSRMDQEKFVEDSL